MAALFCTSCNLITTLTGAAPGPFASVNIIGGAWTVNSGTGPAGNNTISTSPPGGDTVTALLPASITASNGSVLGFGFQFSANPSSTPQIANFIGLSATMALRLSSSGALQFVDASSTVTTGAALSTATRHYIEVYIPTYAATQTVIIMVDGATYLTIVGANTNVGYPVTPQIGIPNSPGGTVPTVIYDSIYLIDTTGSQNNYFLGPRVVTAAIAGGVGQFSAFTPNGAGTDWQCVNSVPPPGDVTYASDATAGDQLAVALTSVSGLGSVNFVYVEASARQEVTGGGRSMLVGVGNGAGTSYGSVQALSTTYGIKGQVFDQNPLTLAPWTVGNLSTLQAAVQTNS